VAESSYQEVMAGDAIKLLFTTIHCRLLQAKYLLYRSRILHNVLVLGSSLPFCGTLHAFSATSTSTIWINKAKPGSPPLVGNCRHVTTIWIGTRQWNCRIQVAAALFSSVDVRQTR
jgi:hypothetical protein